MTASPWGAVQDRQQIAPGIVRVDTASHGGYLLDLARMLEFRALFPTFKPWAGAGAFEEDCDWAAVVMAFPQYFDDAAFYNAARTVQGSATMTGDYMREIRDWLNSPAGSAHRTRAENYARTIAGRWEIGAYGTAPDGSPEGAWGVWLRREVDGKTERRGAIFKACPRQQFYTEAELTEVSHHA